MHCSIAGRGPPEEPPVLQASHLERGLLIHRIVRRQIYLLLQQRGLDLELEGGLVQRARNRLRVGVGDVAGSVGG